jgi:hypothetical protein
LAREAPKAGDTEGRPFEVVKPKSTANPLPEFFEPMKAKLVDSRPVAGSWIYETLHTVILMATGLTAIPLVSIAHGKSGGHMSSAETTLAGMSCFVIADITNPRSAPLELQATVPDYMIPFVPILQDGESGFSMFSNLQKYDWVLGTLGYDSSENLIANLDDAVINPALEKRHELEIKKAQSRPTRHVNDYRKRP